MEKKRIIIYICFSILLMFSMSLNIKAAKSEIKYDTCTYTYKGCTFQFSYTKWQNEDIRKWQLQSLNSQIQSYPDNFCNNENKVRYIGYGHNDENVKTRLEENFGKVKKKLKDGECPELRLSKKPVKECLSDPNVIRPRVYYTCYKLGQKAFKPGKCTNTNSYKCVGNGKLEEDVTTSGLLSRQQNVTAKIDALTGIGILDEDYTCEQLLGDDVVKLLEKIFVIIRILTPILLIVFTMIDYTKAIAAGEDEIKNATTKFIKRSIAAILIFLAPTLIEFIMDVTGISDGTCGLDL